MDGFYFLDKPKGDSSFDLVRKLRTSTGERRIGHAGTLDPLATGLMILALGQATKLLEYLILKDKQYLCTAIFGAVSDTYDAEGNLEAGKTIDCSQSEMEALIARQFSGLIAQIPPKFSALKVNGKKAYELARQGLEVELKAREVEITDFKVTGFRWPEVDFLIDCSKGTYIRSLIHDLGQALGCGAYVKELRRTKVGSFGLELVDGKIHSLEEVASGLPNVQLSREDFEYLKQGRILPERRLELEVMIGFCEQKLVGVLENVEGGIKFKKLIV